MATIGVVCLPSLVRSLEKDIGMASIVAHDEENLVGPARIGSFQESEIDSRSGVCRNLPGGRNSPVSTIVQKGSCIRLAGWLCLRKCNRRANRRYLSRSASAVISHAENSDRVGFGISVDLEECRPSLVYADVSRKALDGGVSRSTDVPDT